MQLKPGSRLRSIACTTEIIVVRSPSDDVELSCGGHPMSDGATSRPSARPLDGFTDGTQVGKRYADDERGLELLCTKGGIGSLAIGVSPIEIKAAKPLPSSD